MSADSSFSDPAADLAALRARLAALIVDLEAIQHLKAAAYVAMALDTLTGDDQISSHANRKSLTPPRASDDIRT